MYFPVAAKPSLFLALHLFGVTRRQWCSSTWWTDHRPKQSSPRKAPPNTDMKYPTLKVMTASILCCC